MLCPLRSLLLGLSLAGATAPALALEPFVASYQAYNEGKLAGSASMKVAPRTGSQWQIDLDVKGTRGFARLAGLNIEQSTVFDASDNQFRPLSQATARRALLMGKSMVGTYDWTNRTAQWRGDIKKERRAPLSLQTGDMSALLMNLAVIRDAAPGRELNYRVVDNGRIRDYQYVVSSEPEIVSVEDLSYSALRVSRANGGNDETIFWVADGVPTPVRILQRENGQDGVDLRLVEYQGVP
ncbi:DUF3108 domain-containing protein [Pseudoxanthomonas sp. PXM03]|jgi:Protein of unknown function (DUF3108).|uniref:DUF3108 domain-containing protein n=1 Tax=Pseudoxanthomonas sp. PXM03 TaxID=2769284 RepID=UPI00178620FB|nr:DUF3108 domain-containing protein [Pseudoxanthomonas sp. PXM03]MBD9435271.1 DUF3108 domain-containing protein [Pseudoxanthomonas sp. PXM03]